MTNEELLEYIKENNCYIIPRDRWFVDGVNVCEAIEKQIPKKPIEEQNLMTCAVCGCREIQYVDWCGIRQMNYCPCCGQAIDWSE